MAVNNPKTLREHRLTWEHSEAQIPAVRANAYDQDVAALGYEFQDLFVALYARLVRRKPIYELMKRAFDVLASLVLLVLASPVFLVVAIMIKINSPGAVFFRHRRLGRNGQEFMCLKFRTMVAEAEQLLENNAQLRRQFEAKFKMESDPRVTRLGALLRKTCIDELPQLFQVLRGEMSLVGPRPIVERELHKYGFFGTKLLSIKPGLSGLWQVCRRNDTTYDERIQMDMFYIDHRCISLDLLLLIYTVIAVVQRRGAF